MAIFFICPFASAQSARSTTRPFTGITFSQESRTNPPQHLYWVQADLTNPAIHLRLAPAGPISAAEKPWETTLLAVSKIARRDRLDIAVNGSFFSPKAGISLLGHQIAYFEGNPARACGWTISDGRLWSGYPIAANYPSLVVAKNGALSIGTFSTPPLDVRQMISGCAMLLRDGKNVAPEGTQAAPRTAVGLDSTGKTLTLFVVDGRRLDISAGMSMSETADEMYKLGCASAINLDSGGSSTLVMRHGDQWPVVNQPSDSHNISAIVPAERPVANALGIVIDKP